MLNVKKSVLTLGLLAAFSSASYAQTDMKTPMHSEKKAVASADQDLMKKLAQANLAEIASGELAQQKSSNVAVKDFAAHMVTDHTKALADLKKLADDKHVTLPSEADKKHQDALKKMSKLEGAAFDKAYIENSGLADHKAAKALVAKTVKEAKDVDLRALGMKMAPTIDMHLKMAQELKAK